MQVLPETHEKFPELTELNYQFSVLTDKILFSIFGDEFRCGLFYRDSVKAEPLESLVYFYLGPTYFYSVYTHL